MQYFKIWDFASCSFRSGMSADSFGELCLRGWKVSCVCGTQILTMGELSLGLGCIFGITHQIYVWGAPSGFSSNETPWRIMATKYGDVALNRCWTFHSAIIHCIDVCSRNISGPILRIVWHSVTWDPHWAAWEAVCLGWWLWEPTEVWFPTLGEHHFMLWAKANYFVRFVAKTHATPWYEDRWKWTSDWDVVTWRLGVEIQLQLTDQAG
jgi:hypothetical protein